MNSYKFSPIKTIDELYNAIKYVIKNENILSKKVIGNELPISYLTIFSHFDDEYNGLLEIINKLGQISDANNGIKVKLKKPINFDNQKVGLLRIRKPDVERPQVGCCDFKIENYDNFKNNYLRNNDNLRLIIRSEYEMIEFFDSNFDILAYVCS